MTTPAEHRRDLGNLVEIARRDLRALFTRFDTADEAREGLRDTLPRLTAIYGAAAATLAADFYDDMRDEAGAPGRFAAIPAALVADAGRFDSLAGWGVGPLYQPTPDWSAALGKVSGGTQRLIVDAARETTLGSIRQDPAAKGWTRETAPTACRFCREIAGRVGFVYSAGTADFSSHDDCDCIAVSAFGEEKKVIPYVPSQRFKTQAARDAHNSRVRAWLAA